MKTVIVSFFILFLCTQCSVQSKSASISGQITISPSLASKIGPSDILYVVALPHEEPEIVTPPLINSNPIRPKRIPIAVQKISPIRFPMKYQLSQKDVLFPETHFEGAIDLIAKIKKDEDLTLDQKGDLEGSYKKNPAAVGANHVDMVIDREI